MNNFWELLFQLMKHGTNTLHLYFCLVTLQKSTEICYKVASTSIGCSDHNIGPISRKTKVPKAEPNIVYRRSYKRFCTDFYVVCNEDAALHTFMKLLIPVTNNVPIKPISLETPATKNIYISLKSAFHIE
jgi:hypothetical protein